MKKNTVCFILLMAALTVSGCSTVRKHPNFNSRIPEIQRILIVPPEVSVQKIVFKGDNEILFDAQKAAVKSMVSTIEQQLKSRGYEVVPYSVIENAIKNNPELGQTMSRLQERYKILNEEAQKRFVAKLKWSGFELNLGTDVNYFADIADVDALVFAGAAGYVKSGGEIAKSLLKTALIAGATLGGVIYTETICGAEGNIAIVDADNGDILWYNFMKEQQAMIANDLTREADSAALSRYIMRPLPKHTAGGKRRVRATATASLPENSVIRQSDETKKEVDISVPANIPQEVKQKDYPFAQKFLEAAKTANQDQPMDEKSVQAITEGIHRFQRGELDSAIQYYKNAIRLDSRNIWGYAFLTDAYLEQKNTAQAKRLIKKISNLDPGASFIPELENKLGHVSAQVIAPEMPVKAN